MKYFFSYRCWLKITIWICLQSASASKVEIGCISNPCIYGICIPEQNSTYTCYCIDGYTGIQCQTNWDECWSSPCLNGGSCIDGIASYNCTCAEGFTGENCAQDINECSSNPCVNGICEDVRNGYVCQCFPGYSGVNCETDLAVCNTTSEMRCYNNGICVEGPGLTYTCQCQPGWTGKRCDNAIDECLSSPCLNGGTCLDQHVNYVCACTFGFTGRDCEIPLKLCDYNLCENGAFCLLENEMQVCYCVPDYHGDRCQYQYDECLLKGRCANGGSCIDGVDNYTCSCPAGITGPNCECQEQAGGEYECTAVMEIDFRNTTNDPRLTTVPNYPTLKQESTTKMISSHWTIYTQTPTVSNSSTLKQESTTKMISSYWTIYTQTPTEQLTTRVLETTERSTQTRETTSVETTFLLPTSDVTTKSTLFPEDTTVVETSYHTTRQGRTESSVISTEKHGTTDIGTEMSTFDTTHEKSAETEILEPTTRIHSLFDYDDYTTRTQEEHTLDGANIARTTETLFTDEYWNGTTVITDATAVPNHTCQNKTCLNGGICDASDHEHRCICRFGWEGIQCEEAITIKMVAFTGKSYLVHHLNNNTSTIIVVKLKTLSIIGVLFYAQITTNMYMFLYVQDGFLKFQFSCGVQTMLFSETKYRINNGFETSVLATVTFNMNRLNEDGECYAALRINDTVAMSGEQTTATEQKLLSTPMLYMGGFPKYLEQQLDLPLTDGLIGCMHSLQVDGAHRDIYTEALDGNEISECSSLACISNPCHQSATCIEQGHSWTCICPSGYIGKICNISICDNNPCQFGATCVQYPTNGFLCLCPLGKHGLYCEQDLEISQPMFSSSIRGYSSFVAYRLPENSVVHTFEIRLKFIPETLEQISLMLFMGQEDRRDLNSDYLSLSFIKGHIALTWNLGAGPRRIFTPRPIRKRGRKMQAIKFGRTGTRAWLSVDGFQNITGRSLARDTQLNVTPIIYVGGYKTLNFVDLPNDLPLHSGFAGCIFNMELHTSHIVLGLQKTHPLSGRSVAQCGTSECSNFTCQHGGACLQYGAAYSCLCPDGWFGPLCAHRHNLCDVNAHKCWSGATCVPHAVTYECDCPVGRSGRYCEKIDARLSDIHFSGKRSYLLYLAQKSFYIKQFSFEFELKPFNDRALILYATEAETNFFASIVLRGGILEFRILIFGLKKKLEIDSDIVSVKSGTIITVGEWTKIRAGRFGQKLYLLVNGITNSQEIPPDNNVILRSLSIYFGGSRNLANIPFRVISGLPESYYGCIRQFFLNYNHISLTTESIHSARNIADCDGTPCGAEVCANGGTCWLNATLEPYCMCPQEYQGDRCERQASCDLASCKNNGQCVLQNNDLVCQCPLGWIGPFCEQEMPSLTPFLRGNSYIIVDQTSSPSIKKRQSFLNSTRPLYFIYVKFSTTEENGLLLWNTQADTFFGIGVDNGNLKIVWSIENSMNQFSVDSNVTISNGIWHSVVFKFNVTLITVTVDEEEIFVEVLPSNKPLTLDNLFYLGGFPDENVHDKTKGIFSSNFYGCIEEFAWNEKIIINNFKRYKGENLGSCIDYGGSN